MYFRDNCTKCILGYFPSQVFTRIQPMYLWLKIGDKNNIRVFRIVLVYSYFQLEEYLDHN